MKVREFRRDDNVVASTCWYSKIVEPEPQNTFDYSWDLAMHPLLKQTGLDLWEGKSIWGDLISNSFHAVKHSSPRVSDGII